MNRKFLQPSISKSERKKNKRRERERDHKRKRVFCTMFPRSGPQFDGKQEINPDEYSIQMDITHASHFHV